MLLTSWAHNYYLDQIYGFNIEYLYLQAIFYVIWRYIFIKGLANPLLYYSTLLNELNAWSGM